MWLSVSKLYVYDKFILTLFFLLNIKKTLRKIIKISFLGKKVFCDLRTANFSGALIRL